MTLQGPAAVFDRAADTYDQVGVPWFQPIGAALVVEVDPRPGERALDVGCGRGAALLPLADAVGPTGSVLGIDLAPRMVEALARDAAHLGHVEVRVADASRPGLPPAAYDVLTASLVLFFLPDPAAALRGWVDLLVPGGRLGVSTFGPQEQRWQDVDALFGPYLPQQLKDARTSGRSGPFASDEGMAALLRDAGLEDVRTVTTEVVARFRDTDHLVEWTWSHGQRALWEHVPEDERPAVRARIDELLGAGEQSLRQQVRLTLGRRPG
jgi:trans-aconitate methyltransferase